MADSKRSFLDYVCNLADSGRTDLFLREHNYYVIRPPPLTSWVYSSTVYDLIDDPFCSLVTKKYDSIWVKLLKFAFLSINTFWDRNNEILRDIAIYRNKTICSHQFWAIRKLCVIDLSNEDRWWFDLRLPYRFVTRYSETLRVFFLHHTTRIESRIT